MQCQKQFHSKASKNQAKTRLVRQNQGTMQQEALLYFWAIFLIKMRLKYEKNVVYSHFLAMSTPWKKSEARE